MTPLPRDHPEFQAAIQSAQKGDFDQARHHLNVAALEGVPQPLIQRETVWIDSLERAHAKTRAEKLGLAVAIPYLSYLFLSVAEPPAYGVPVWIGLAFLAVPMITGFAIARCLPGSSRASVALKGFAIAGSAMAIYTIFNLSIIRSRIAERVDSLAIFLVGALVALVFALAAGAVAGFTSALFVKEAGA